jgi:class 3 adenylate cyclase
VAELPSGTVTFLFTDLEGSTRLWDEHPDAVKAALARHDNIVREAITSHGGHVVKTTGDGFHASFATAHDAVESAITAQRALGSEEWTGTGPLRVRMGLHTCEAELRDGDYYGSAVNRAARLMSAAQGGQVLASLSGVSAALPTLSTTASMSVIDRVSSVRG